MLRRPLTVISHLSKVAGIAWAAPASSCGGATAVAKVASVAWPTGSAAVCHLTHRCITGQMNLTGRVHTDGALPQYSQPCCSLHDVELQGR